METTIIKQLEKALACKDDKELRLRVEILLDILKENRSTIRQPQPMLTTQPMQPIQPIQPAQPIQNRQPRPQSSGAIIGGGEEIRYKRPKGT